MLLIRVLLPNRPGALGAVATALGAIGADINLVEIVEKRGDTEIDEFILDLPESQTLESLVDACDSLPGVQVEWIRNYPRGGGIESDLDLLHRMSADSDRAAEILVAASPLVFRAQWGLLLDVSGAARMGPEAGTARVTFSTPAAPELGSDTIAMFAPFDTTHRVRLEDGWLPGWQHHHAVVAPIPGERAVVVGRRGEPEFFRSELTRLDYLVGVTAGAAESAEMRPRNHPPIDGAHRVPLAPPLYDRSIVSPPGDGPLV